MAGEQNAACTDEAQVGTHIHASAAMIAPSSSAAMDATTDSSSGNAIPQQDWILKSGGQMLPFQHGIAAKGEDCMQVSVSQEPTTEQSQLQVDQSEGPAEQEDHMQVSASEGSGEEEDRTQVDASEEPTVPEHVVSVTKEEQRRRADTPEELANLGKAVDMVQARSCQLSPSLLTVGRTPPDMDSPARNAFERGRHECQSQAYQIKPCLSWLDWAGPHLGVGGGAAEAV